MDKIEASKFIDKAISKTKEKKLCWNILPTNFHVKSLPGEKNSSFTSPFDSVLLKGDSYSATFKTGTLLLLVYSPGYSPIPSDPPDGCMLSLRIQDGKSKYSVEISNSDSDNFNSVELIRLYNLIDKGSPSLSTLIDDFLNS